MMIGVRIIGDSQKGGYSRWGVGAGPAGFQVKDQGTERASDMVLPELINKIFGQFSCVRTPHTNGLARETLV